MTRHGKEVYVAESKYEKRVKKQFFLWAYLMLSDGKVREGNGRNLSI